MRDASSIHFKRRARIARRYLDAKYLVAGHQFVLPIKMTEDLHQRMFAFAGKHRVEMFRVDRNDVSRRDLDSSDNRGFIPFWEVGGVLQLPTGYTVWKANHADTMAYPVVEGDAMPGRADSSEEDWGISVQVVDAQRVAPWAVTINAKAGTVAIAGHPSSQPPRAGADLGVRTFTIRLVLHESSWLAFHPCELDVKTYAQLFKNRHARRVGNVYSALATSDLHIGMVRERVQPSIVVRSMYGGDDRRRVNIMKHIGQTIARGRPMAEREASTKAFLDHVHQHGVPPLPAK